MSSSLAAAFDNAFINGVPASDRFNIVLNPAFKILMRACAALGAKLYVLAFFTARARVSTRVFALNEDGANYTLASFLRFLLFLNPFTSERAFKVRFDPETKGALANRLWQLQQHTVENTVAWFLAALAFVAAGANETHAYTCMYGYVALRCLHSFIYLVVQQQPYRAICWAAQVMITLYMAIAVLRQ